MGRKEGMVIMADRERKLGASVNLALSVVPGVCSCLGREGREGRGNKGDLCNKCFVEEVLTRCLLYITHREAVLSYSEEVDRAAVYPGKNNGLLGLIYAVLGLAGEAGEVANALKHELRDNQRVVDYLNRLAGGTTLQELGVDCNKLIEEDGDVLFYVARTAREAGILDIRQVMGENIIKVRDKRELILNERRKRDADQWPDTEDEGSRD